jgi:hypothetical protein
MKVAWHAVPGKIDRCDPSCRDGVRRASGLFSTQRKYNVDDHTVP